MPNRKPPRFPRPLADRPRPSFVSLYAQIPRLPSCTGDCARYCRGPIPLYRDEFERIGRAIRDARDIGWVEIGEELELLTGQVLLNPRSQGMRPVDQPYCPFLRHGRCITYAVRPLVCRMWGTIEGFPCPWGCQPDPGYLSPQQAARIIMLACRYTEAEIETVIPLMTATELESGLNWTNSPVWEAMDVPE